ncbi:hypothetical protein [Staphylococcus haemolyticus]|nr:hypothetical protein [Staphylococcus haemolyticus]
MAKRIRIENLETTPFQFSHRLPTHKTALRQIGLMSPNIEIKQP